MNPNVRRFEYSRLCEDFDSPRVYPVYDTHQSHKEVIRFASEEAARDWCDSENTRMVQSEEVLLTDEPVQHTTPTYTTPAYVAEPLIATPKTDAILSRKYRFKGREDYKLGLTLEQNPYSGMLAGWWRDGWNEARSSDPSVTEG